MYWTNFLHFYQPPTQKKYWVDRITDEAYRRILAELKKAPQAKVTLNINAGLLEFWDKFGHRDVIDGFGELLGRGQIELTGSAKYHPLLPRLPRDEIVRQIELSQETGKHYFGDLYQPKGFFPPEMAYDRKVAEVVAGMGYEWIIAEELSYATRFNAVDYRKIYEVTGMTVLRSFDSTRDRPEPVEGRQAQDKFSAAGKTPASLTPGVKSSETPGVSPAGVKEAGVSPGKSPQAGERLKIFFRQRDISYKILSGQLGTAKLFLRELGDRIKRDEYLLTAMDGETFGHHRPGMEKLLFELYKTPKIKTALISELLELFPMREVVETRPATWALMQKDLEMNVPFARWEDPGNEIHKMQWELTDLAIKAVRNSKFQVPLALPIPPPPKLRKTPASFPAGKTPGVSEDLTPGVKEAGSPDFDGELSRTAGVEEPARPAGGSVERRQWLKARQMLDRALHSDQYWWACARPWWSLEMIERGAYELHEAVLAVPDAPDYVKRQAQDLYYKIITEGFRWQREGRVEELARKEDETMRMLADRGIEDLPKKEIQKMVETIKRELRQVVQNQEYERAVQLRDRIKELEGYIKER